MVTEPVSSSVKSLRTLKVAVVGGITIGSLTMVHWPTATRAALQMPLEV